MAERGLNVRDSFVDVEALHQTEGFAPVLLRLVGELDARFEAPEQIRRQRKAAACGVSVTNLPDDIIHTEDFLDHDDSGSLAGCRSRDICAKTAVGTPNRNIFAAHLETPLTGDLCGWP